MTYHLIMVTEYQDGTAVWQELSRGTLNECKEDQAEIPGITSNGKPIARAYSIILDEDGIDDLTKL